MSSAKCSLPEPAHLALAICHELGNHMTAIRFSARALSVGSKEVRWHDIETLSARSGRALGQIRNLLEEPAIEPQTPTVSEVLARVQQMSHCHGVELRGGPTDPIIGCELDILSRQLAQLAYDATEAGATRVRIGYTAQSQVTFWVEDNGPPVSQESLFRPEPQRGRALALQVAAVSLERNGIAFAWVSPAEGTTNSAQIGPFPIHEPKVCGDGR